MNSALNRERLLTDFLVAESTLRGCSSARRIWFNISRLDGADFDGRSGYALLAAYERLLRKNRILSHAASKGYSMEIDEAARRVNGFEGNSLTSRLSELESLFQGLTRQQATSLCDEQALNSQLLDAAYQVKTLASQIHVVIHAAGILMSLPAILQEGETVEYLSLGAGNTGRKFDLETNQRVAEFKFIHWKGGPESIRQNSLFKDFYELAEADTNKKKYLYVLGLTQPLKFLGLRGLVWVNHT